jgi:hypothetical protein
MGKSVEVKKLKIKENASTQQLENLPPSLKASAISEQGMLSKAN